MNPGTRACVAATAICAASGNAAKAVYDYGESRWRQISGDVDDRKVKLYDHERNCHFSGSVTNIYDYGENKYVVFKMNGTSFSGHDHATNTDFSGTVSGRSVNIYDYQTGQNHQYSM